MIGRLLSLPGALVAATLEHLVGDIMDTVPPHQFPTITARGADLVAGDVVTVGATGRVEDAYALGCSKRVLFLRDVVTGDRREWTVRITEEVTLA